MVAALGAALLSATVTSVGGVVPMVVLAPLIAVGFAIRFGGTTYAIAKGRWGMPWGARGASWVALGLAAALLGLAGSILTVAGFGAFVVLDAMGGFVKREEKPLAPKARKRRRGLYVTLGVVAYLAGVAAFHAFVGRYFSFGVLLTWALLCFGFCLFLLLSIRGTKASEAHLRAPASHKRHERREEIVADPQRQRAEEVLRSFQARGDAGPFLELVRAAALAADLKPEDVATLEQRILGSFARAGTDRENDVRAALDEVERFLSLRQSPLETRR